MKQAWLIATALWLAPPLGAQSQNAFEVPWPWSAPQIERHLSSCRKPTLKQLRGRWQLVSMLSKSLTGDMTNDKSFMTIGPNPDSGDPEDFIAVFDTLSEQQLAAGAKMLGAQRREDLELGFKLRVDMERDPESAAFISILLRAKMRKDWSCRISGKGHLACRVEESPLQGASPANTNVFYAGFTRVKR